MDLFKTFSKRNFGFEELLGKDERKTSETFVSCGTNLFKERKTTQSKIRNLLLTFSYYLVLQNLHTPFFLGTIL